MLFVSVLGHMVYFILSAQVDFVLKIMRGGCDTMLQLAGL